MIFINLEYISLANPEKSSYFLIMSFFKSAKAQSKKNQYLIYMKNQLLYISFTYLSAF